MKALDLLVGEWSMDAQFENLPTADGDARVIFEWLPGEQFLVERWAVPIPEAPDGIAIIGADPDRRGPVPAALLRLARRRPRLQDDARGEVWTLWRDEPDFSPLDFRQRYTGTVSDDGQTIAGAWEICHDGTTWEHDFDLSYRKRS